MILRCCLLLLVIFSPALALSAQSPTDLDVKPQNYGHLKVVATIRPVHSLLSAIMQGTGKPVLLLDNSQSVHHYSLRPSERRLLANADLIFWVGEALEGFMPRVLNAIPKQAQVVTLIETKNLRLLAPRSSDSHALHSDTDHHHSTFDPHIWLSVDNAILIAKKLATTLIKFEPELKTIYQFNLKKLMTRLDQLKKHISLSLNNNKPDNYLVYHDAFQYFEDSINTKPLAVISPSEEQSPGLRHLSQIHALLSENKVSCLIYNSTALPPIAENLIKDSNIDAIYLNPTGRQFQTGPELYFQIMQAMMDTYKRCQ